MIKRLEFSTNLFKLFLYTQKFSDLSDSKTLFQELYKNIVFGDYEIVEQTYSKTKCTVPEA